MRAASTVIFFLFESSNVAAFYAGKERQSMLLTYIRRFFNLDEPDELLQLLEQSRNFKKVPKLKRLKYPVTHCGMRLIGVYRAELKNNTDGLFTIIRIYRSTIAPYVYHAVWTYGDKHTPDELMNLRNKSLEFFTADQVKEVVAAIVSTMEGVAAIHKPYTAR